MRAPNMPDSTPRGRWGRRLLVGLLLFAGLALAFTATQICLPAFVLNGVLIDRCADGDFRQTLRLVGQDLRRGTTGHVLLSATAHYTEHDADEALSTAIR